MSKGFSKKGLTPKSENISDWYHDLVILGDLADYSDVKGSMIIKPNGYAIWEKVQQYLDAKFKGDNPDPVQNVYFPLFIPMSLLQKEKDHLEGFSPELAVVTHAGGEELSEPLVVRPTSETIMYKTFADWIHSYRDLPLKVNQWCNVVRWEKRTNPFLRTSEFLWQEGHTAHATAEEAEDMAKRALQWYSEFYKDIFAIEPIVGIKSESEKFAGADRTYTVELVMPDGKALQAATSHNLGQNFSKVFEIEFLDAENKKQNPHQTSWGLSTRAIGGLILTHGDDSGLVIPPNAAPYQVVIVPITKNQSAEDPVWKTALDLQKSLIENNIRVVMDTRIEDSVGSRINNWELRGVPLRLEIGAKEIENKQIAYARRDTLEKGFFDYNFSDSSDALMDLYKEVDKLLKTIQETMHQKSVETKKDKIKEVDSYEEYKRILTEDRALMRVFWCEDSQCEAKVKAETKSVSRCLEVENIAQKENGSCIFCNKPAHRKWIFGQSY
jgi:prolyl-tRNA synthetase